jgi:FkbM family methyltransferase
MINLKNIIRIIKVIFRMSPKNIYHVFLRAQETLPKLSVNKSKFGLFSGFENDYTYESALAKGCSEPHFIEIIEYFLNENSIAIDLGANIGTHSILMSKKASLGQVSAFEAQSLTFSILQNNLLLNTCKNVNAYRFAICNSNNLVLSMDPFSFSSGISNGSTRVNNKNSALGDLVLTRTLDSFQFASIDFIKIDVQGSEFNVLCGAEQLLKQSRPVLFLEIEEQHLKALGSSSKLLIEKAMSLNYALYRIENSYPCDHICIPIEFVEEFERDSKQKFSFTLSNKIFGKRVLLKFKKDTDQNYSSIEVLE